MTQKTLGGEFLRPETNPFLRQAFERALETALPAQIASAQAAGRYGGGAQALLEGRTRGETAAGIYGPAYERERERQVQAVAAAPALAEADFTGEERLAQVGAAREAIAQRPIEEAIQRFEYEQLAPYEKLGLFLQAIGQPVEEPQKIKVKGGK